MRILFILATIFMLFLTTPAMSMTTNEYISALEQKLFGTTYENQSATARIDRIEMQIYDNSYSGSNEERLSKIDKIYPKSEFKMGQAQMAIAPTSTDWYSQDYPEPEEKADYNNYPIVTEIEQSIYKKNFQGEDIYKRLSRLEQELYGNVKSEQSLQERVETLKSVLPKKHYNRFAAQNMGFEDFGMNTPTDYLAKSYDNENYFNSNSIINELELETFNRSYAQEDMSRRIERLEHFYFGGVSMGQNEQDRINKLASVVFSAKNMSPYSQLSKGGQWAGILMNLLMIGLGFLL